jgi:hypothetical protein
VALGEFASVEGVVPAAAAVPAEETVPADEAGPSDESGPSDEAGRSDEAVSAEDVVSARVSFLAGDGTWAPAPAPLGELAPLEELTELGEPDALGEPAVSRSAPGPAAAAAPSPRALADLLGELVPAGSLAAPPAAWLDSAPDRLLAAVHTLPPCSGSVPDGVLGGAARTGASGRPVGGDFSPEVGAPSGGRTGGGTGLEAASADCPTASRSADVAG